MRVRIVLVLAALGALWWLGRGGAGTAALLAAQREGLRPSPLPGFAEPAALAAIGWNEAKGAGAEAAERPVVVLSPGHGWWSADAGQVDAGDQAGGLVEKDVALDVARQAQEMLARCPVEARLTRTGDDKERTLAGVHEIVNDQGPRLAIAIHTSGADAPTGPLAWYTVGGADDAGSRRLADRLALTVAGWTGLRPRGAWPETAGGGLYIHPWQTTAALVELGSLGADADALRGGRREFARAITQAVLEELGLPVECAGAAQVRGWPAAVAFPDEGLSTSLTLENDGLTAWDPTWTRLQAAGESYGAAASYALPGWVQPGERVTFELPARAPDKAGVYEQSWQVVTLDATGATRPVGAAAKVVLVVTPREARELKVKLEAKLAEMKAAGAAKADEMVQEIKDELKAWAAAEAQRQAAKCLGTNTALALAGVFIGGSAKQRDGRRRTTDN